MLFSLLVLVGTGVLFKIIPTGFIPDQDTGQLNVSTEAAQGASFEDMVRRQQQVAAIVQRDTNVQALMSTVGGGGGSSASNTGRLFSSRSSRSASVWPPPISSPSCAASCRASPASRRTHRSRRRSRSAAGSRRASISSRCRRQDVDNALRRRAEAARRRGTKSDQLQDVTSDMQNNNPQVNVDIDRVRAAAFGVTADQIESSLYDAYGSRQVSTIYTPSNEYEVISSCCRSISRTCRRSDCCSSAAPPGSLVPLKAVATLEQDGRAR